MGCTVRCKRYVLPTVRGLKLIARLAPADPVLSPFVLLMDPLKQPAPQHGAPHAQAYPEFARALLEKAPAGFNEAVFEWERRHGKVRLPAHANHAILHATAYKARIQARMSGAACECWRYTHNLSLLELAHTFFAAHSASHAPVSGHE
jgi:hypothetical protein